MNNDVFKPAKLTAACLNDLRVSLVACGDEQLDGEAQRHVDGCDFCRGRLHTEQAQVRAQVYEPLPAAFARTPPTQSRWRWLVGAMASGAVCAVAAWAVLVAPQQDHGVRLKGGATSLSATVQRKGETVLDDEPLESMHTLREGDQLRLRLAGEHPAYVVVQGLEEGAWVTYYKGVSPPDGWLPFGIELTRDGRTRLRLLSCQKPVDDTNQDTIGVCVERLFTL